jgi:transposase
MQNFSYLIKSIQDYDFKATYKVERNAKVAIKLQALHHLQEGKTLRAVAEMVLCTQKTVKGWLTRFVEFDYEGLLQRPGRGRKPRLPVVEEENFKDALDELSDNTNGGSIDAKEIQKLLLDKFDCNYSRSGVYTLLDRINVVWITARSKHPKSSQEAMDEFKKMFPLEVQKIRDKFFNQKIEVWWQDEARVGQQGTLSRVWARKGTRPRVVRQRQFISTYIFGAVCPDKDDGCALILPECNSGMMQIHLDLISEKIEKGHHAILLMDRASWHTTETLIIPGNMSLMPLPSYSPELNPVEQVWKQLRKNNLSNRVYKNYDEIMHAAAIAWNALVDEEGTISKLCSRNWAKISDEKTCN